MEAERLRFLEEVEGQLRAREATLQVREGEVRALRGKYEALAVQLETAVAERERAIDEKHREVMAMQDGLYEKVRRKRAELEGLTRDLGETAARLRDCEALAKDRAALLARLQAES